MATDLDVSTAAWGTAGLLIAAGDPITGATGSAWASQVAENTGWLYHRPQMIFNSKVHAKNETNETITGAVYLEAGTYSFMGYAKVTIISDGTVTVAFDGTTLAQGTADGAYNSPQLTGWSGTAGWYTVSSTAVVGVSPDQAIGTCGISMIYGSWAF